MRQALILLLAVVDGAASLVHAQDSGGVVFLDSAQVAQLIRDSRTRPIWDSADSTACHDPVDSLVGHQEPLVLGVTWIRPEGLIFQADSILADVYHGLWRAADSSLQVEALLGTTASLGTGFGGGYWGFLAPSSLLPDGTTVGPTHCSDCLQIHHRCWTSAAGRIYYVALGQYQGWGPAYFAHLAAFPLPDDRYLILEVTSLSDALAPLAARIFRSVRPAP